MAYPFAAAEVLTAADLNAMIGAPTQNAITSSTYTAALLDAGKTVTLNNASAVTLTIPAQATVAWVANTQLNFLNIGAGTVTITPAATVTINGTPLTLATSKGGSLVRTESNTWTFVPFSAGVEAANFTNAGTTYSSGGINYKYVEFLASGDLIVDQAGFADILVIGGGGSGGRNRGGGGGAGGHLIVNNAYFSAATHTVVVGAGGAGISTVGYREGFPGLSSRVASYYGVGGAGGASAGGTIAGYLLDGDSGGSGSGATGFNNTGSGTGGPGLSGQGNNGGNSTGGTNPNNAAGGGGGAGGVGGNAVTSTGGSGAAGLSNSITNTAVVRAGGGGGGAFTAGGAAGTGGSTAGTSDTTNSSAATANTGSGSGGTFDGASGNGGSGIVIVRVVV